MKCKLLNKIGFSAFLIMSFSAPAHGIQITQQTITKQGKVIENEITVGITQPQLDLGLIDGFFVNLSLFPFTGPLPEITLFEFDLLGATVPQSNPQEILFEFNETITDPTSVVANLNIEFDESTPEDLISTFELSSVDSNLQPIETLTFNVPAHVPEPTTILGTSLVLGLGFLARRRRKK